MRELQSRVIALAQEAGRIALGHYGKVDPELKTNLSVVTAADREIEAFLQDQLPRLLPGSVFVGEEMARDTSMVASARQTEWVWVVDPIDGTAGFLDGLDLFCICIGLLQRGCPQTGVLFFPALDHLYSAIRGQGAECDGRAIHVLGEEPIADRRVLYVDAYAHLRYLFRYTGKIRSMSSTALHLGLVARGVGVGAVSGGHVWDYVAAAAILEEAGGVLRHLDGRPPDWLGALDGSKLTPPLLGAPAWLWESIAGSISFR
jgi:myo-inositol-1(or 4)-monophosphatase